MISILKERKDIAPPLNPLVSNLPLPLLSKEGIKGEVGKEGKRGGEFGVQMTIVYNRSCEKSTRKMLRSNLPKAEVILWSRLKNKGLDGHKFRRQYSIGRFVIDFYCPRVKLAIEVDGDSHFSDKSEVDDKERGRFIESFKISFLRFTNKDIYENLDEVLAAIKARVEKKLEESSGVNHGKD